MKKIANLKGVKALRKHEQKSINGGLPPCPLPDYSLNCYIGPFYCYPELPRCNPDDDEN